FRGALATIVALLEQRENITLAEARDALATNRRSTQALLETLDRRGVTRRQGEGRVLGDAARARPA
ncbi:MAG: SelB C-terminal domain-containing protein, partial [Chloroflexi bacterium]|nr:SelB C-terminal domain-containing protein [Chloroflexota bacterium]